jgi:ATP-dependent DNA helicase RecQ
MNKPTEAGLQRILSKIFGHKSLRPGQREVIENVVAGADTLAIMPTGAGKSLCYQLPALQLRGTTVIVSPLISLMKDQADKLEEHGLDAAALNSALSEQEQAEALAEIEQRQAEFVFATPERLAEREFIDLLKKTPIDLFVIDEAHCISQWGHDFRPAFLEIAAAVRELRDPPLLALTATATPEVVEDIKAQLARPDMRVINAGVYRPNLQFAVRQVTNADEKRTALLQAVRARRGSGIVYCATVKAAIEVDGWLREAGESALLYHGRLSARARTQAQETFMAGDARVMVATNAFGMGIDKPDIRFVVHYQLPATLEAYYQECGRAGRDGDNAHCTLLYDHGDRRIQFFFMGGRYPDLDDILAVHRALQPVAAEQPRLTRKQLLEHELPLAKNKARIVIGLLQEANLLATAAVETKRLEALANGYRERAENDRRKLERITFYAQSALCRWKIILDYFGESAQWERCGHCDNCLRIEKERARPAIADTTAEPAVTTRLRPGLHVRVPKYGRGAVEATAGDSVTVRFASGETREFLRAYVIPAERGNPPRSNAAGRAEILAAK